VRAIPKRGTELRRRVAGSSAGLLLAAMVAISLLCWGALPIACLWIASQIDYLTGSVFLGIILALVALFPLLFGALSILRGLDYAWILGRRAAGHDQRIGLSVRIFAATAAACALAFAFWFLVIHGPGPPTPARNEW
jgi:hypothetical protein